VIVITLTDYPLRVGRQAVPAPVKFWISPRAVLRKKAQGRMSGLEHAFGLGAQRGVVSVREWELLGGHETRVGIKHVSRVAFKKGLIPLRGFLGNHL